MQAMGVSSQSSNSQIDRATIMDDMHMIVMVGVFLVIVMIIIIMAMGVMSFVPDNNPGTKCPQCGTARAKLLRKLSVSSGGSMLIQLRCRSCGTIYCQTAPAMKIPEGESSS